VNSFWELTFFIRKTELLVVFFVLSLLFVSAVSAIVFGSSSP
jgi:hypothetical protein